MKLIYFLFVLVNCNKIIKNINLPSCKNCIYFTPSEFYDFTSSLNKCKKFGKKKIITDEIIYDYVDISINDEYKHRSDRKYFKKEKNISTIIFLNLSLFIAIFNFYIITLNIK